MSDSNVYEIDLTKKYIIQMPSDLSMMELEQIKNLIDEWVLGDYPFLVLNKSIKLVKVSETV